ncbi:hypothetical protein BsWGS_18588 [Bradybaena similaris]
MRSKDNEDKHHTRWSGGAKQTCNRQRIVSICKEPEVVDPCQGKLKKLSPTLSCSRYSRRSAAKPNCKKRIKTSFSPQRLKSTYSTGIARKLATCEDWKKDVHLENNEASLRSIICSGSTSETAGRECFVGTLDTDETGSNQEQELKQKKPVYSVSQRQNVNKQAIINHSLLMVGAQASIKAGMTRFNFRKYLKDLVENQCWLADKIIQLKNELNVIEKEMEELKGRGYLKGSTSDSEMMLSAQCRLGGRGSVCSSNNCVPSFKPYLFGGNKSRNLASSLKISESSSSVVSPAVSSGDNNTDFSRNATVITRRHPRRQEMSGTLSGPNDISLVVGASELCSSRDKPAAGVFRFVQYGFLLFLVAFQLIVQLVTMGR